MATVDTSDSRFVKAVAIADNAGQWLKCRTHDGKKAYGIRSQRDASHIYFVTRTSCDCTDAQRHPEKVCKHRLAVLIHVARVAGGSKPMPATDVLDGLAVLVADKNPTLKMVRHPDGSLTWESETAADRYDEIFKRFED
ncbi:MAG: hypothetical protein JOZ81_08405 [Chloroflexi bacterium]|nr:hypothetical protein [Chloroflexota bacterium]